MANSTKDDSTKVSLEELLRFKRAERPNEAFWDTFDGELHERMMQTLVKKDPWPVQILRGLSGKIAQTTAIAAVAAVLALMVIRPTFITTHEQMQPTVASMSDLPIAASVEAAQVLDAAPAEMDASLMAEADYEIETLAVPAGNTDSTITHDFSLDHMDVASYDIAAYSADSPLAGFTSTGVASLVY